MWTRRLSLTFGHGILAASTVVCVFMAGLGLGSLAAGWWLDRRPPARPLRWYGGLEALIAVWALLTLALIPALEGGCLALARSGGPLPLVRLVGTAIVLLPPTLAMGATLPLMAAATAGGSGWVLAGLYGINTLGACLGAALGGYLWLPAFGYTLSLVGTAGLNLLLAALAWQAPGPGPAPSRDTPLPRGHAGWPLLVSSFLSGCAGMVAQIVWIRAAILTLGSSTYAFSAVLTVFLAGVGGGSLLLASRSSAARLIPLHLVRAQLAASLLMLVSIPLLGTLPVWFVQWFPAFVGGRVLLLQLLLCVLALLGPCLALGTLLPMGVELYRAALGARVGRIYGANTAGCCTGALLAGFGLIPAVGLEAALKVGVALQLMAGAAVLVAVPGRRAGSLLGLGLGGLALVCAPAWDSSLLSAGSAIYAADFEALSTSELKREMTLPPAFYRDGLSTTVSIHVTAKGHLTMKVNGKVDASLSPADLQTTWLLGLLPAVVHGSPQRAALIGLGGGMTLESLACWPGLARVDCAELEPAVLEAQRFWRGFNGGAVARPNVRMHLGDGRFFMQATPETFDLIVSEPSNPWIAGVGNLFTREFYRTCQARLRPGGLMCQWFHLYSVSDADVKSVVRTFFTVFPHGSVWATATGDICLMGSVLPVAGQPRSVDQIPLALRQRLFKLGLYSPEALWGCWLSDRARALDWAGEGRLLTDDRPQLEFSAPFHLYEDRLDSNMQMLRALRTEPLPPWVPVSPRSLAKAAQAWLVLGDKVEVRRALSRFAGPALRLPAAELRYAEGSRDPAASFAAIEQGDEPHLAAFLLAEHLRANRRLSEAASLYELALEAPPEAGRGLIARRLGECLLALRQAPRAVARLEESARVEPCAETLVGLAEAYAASGQLERAQRTAVRALALNPAYLPGWEARARFLLKQSRWTHAAAAYRELLELAPASSEAWVALGCVEASLGRLETARQAYREALRWQPENTLARRNLRALRGNPEESGG